LHYTQEEDCRVAVDTDVQAKIEERTPTSRELDRSGHEVLTALAVGTLAVPYPIYIRESKGSRVWDVDGNEYIDLSMGFGPHILGHAPDVVVQAVKDAAERGLQWALHNPYQEPFARLIVDASPCAEKVVFCNSGTEATMHAMRAARAFSGKTTVAVFDGCYHGAQDYALVSVDSESPLDRPTFLPWGDGVPAETLSTMTMLPFWRDAAFDLIREKKNELALVMVEPVQGAYPGTGQGEWLRELADVCKECGVLLLFDEMITGFRLAYGGAQEYFQVVPDLVTYGKAVGGGMNIGCIAGRADVMEVFSHQWSPEFTAEGTRKPSVWSAGTFSGNPISMEAGRAQLTYLRDHPEVYEYLSTQSTRLADEINAFCAAEDIPAVVMQAESIMFIRIQRGEIRTARDDQGGQKLPGPLKHVDDRFFTYLVNRGIIIPGVHQFHVSAAHTPEDVDFVIDAFKQSFLDVKAEGLLAD
jgi:glutamate-1-semialdehyde 2,1-aminomutase